MLLSFDLTTRRIGADAIPGARIAAIKRSRTEALWIKLTDEGALRMIEAGQSLKVTLKEDGKFDSEPVFVLVVTSEHYHAGSKSYRALANYITAGMNVLLGAGDGDSTTDKPKADLMGDIQYFESEGADPICSEVFKATIFNNVGHEEDGTPLNLPTPEQWLSDRVIRYLPAAVGLTGGGSTKLDGHATVDLAVAVAVALFDDSASGSPLRVYELVAGTDEENAPNVIRPDDHDPSTNPKVWKLRNRGGSASSWDDLEGKPSLFPPSGHAASHGVAGSDPITLAQSQITGLATDLAAKAPLASPALTGTPSAPTAAPGTNSTQIATTAFVLAVRNALLNSAPGALDTLNELAAALGNDANFATTITNALAGKASTTHAATHAPGGSNALPWTTIHARGTTGARPAAAASNAGYIYFDTTLGKLQRSDGSTWHDIGGGSGSKRIEVADSAARLALTPGTHFNISDIIAEVGRQETSRVMAAANTGNRLAGKHIVLYDGSNQGWAFWFSVDNAEQVSLIQCQDDANGSLNSRYFTLHDSAGSVGVWFNTGGLPEITTIEFAGLYGGSFYTGSTGKYFLISGNGVGRRCVWFNSGSESQPSVSCDGYNEVTIDPAYSAEQIASAVVSAMQAYGGWSVDSAGTTMVSATTSAPGSYDDPDVGDSGTSINVIQQGTSAGSGPGGHDRLIEVALANNDPASEVGSKLATALTSDTEFDAVNSAGEVTITNAVAGAVPTIASGSTGFSTSTLVPGGDTPEPSHGQPHSAEVPIVDGNAAQSVADALNAVVLSQDGQWTSSQTGGAQYDFTVAAIGPTNNANAGTAVWFTVTTPQQGAAPGGTFIAVKLEAGASGFKQL